MDAVVGIESQLLAACAVTEIDDHGAEVIRHLAGRVGDWDKLFLMAAQHRIMPLVYLNLESHGQGAVPENVLARFESAFIENTGQTVFLADALIKVVEVLGSNGIKVVPFKGPVLAEDLFGDLTLRQYSDLDIMVARADAPAAIALLVENGFSPENGSVMTNRQCRAYVNNEFNYVLVRYGGRLVVDLQWELSARFSPVKIELEALAERLERVRLNGIALPGLPAEELLCYLCIHGTRHRWMFLDLVCCVNQLIIKRPQLDWGRVLAYAGRLKCTKTVLLGLYLCNAVMNAYLPELIEKKIAGCKGLKNLLEEACVGLFSGYAQNMVMDAKFDPFLFRVMDGRKQKAGYCLRTIFLPTKEDMRCFPLPPFLSFLWYGLRPVRLMAEYMKRMLI